jgi:NADH-quinone oxidoreductase subunit L
MTLAIMLATARGPLDTWSPTLMVELALFLPALAALFVLIFTIDARRATALVAILGSLAMLLFAGLALAIEVAHPGHLENNLTFLQFFTGQPGGASEFVLQWGVVADPLSAVMLVALASVNLLAMVSALESMRRDDGFIRFVVVSLSTTFAMAGVIVSTNYFEMFVFWVLLSLAGFLLIGHWWRLPDVAAAARRAFLYLALGDALLLVAVVYIFFRFQDLSFGHLSLAYTGGKVSANGLLIMALLVFGAAMSKSAQLPLHGWLSGSVEAPAPAAALLSAATLAVAGVYLVARTYDLFHTSPRALTVVAVVGGSTALAAAFWALGQDQIKRLIAYVIMGNLGLMMLTLGLGVYSGAVFHLFTSAFSVALLVLGSGAVSAGLRTESIREMGGLLRRMPVVGWTMLVGIAGLSGVPPLSGFWSKGAMGTPVLSPLNVPAAIAMLLGTLLAAAALFRLFAGVFLGETARRRRFEPGRIQDVGGRARTALILLAIPTLASGLWALPVLKGGFLSLVRLPGLKAAHLDGAALALTALVAVAGLAIGWLTARVTLFPGRAGTTVEHAFFIGDAVGLAVRRGVVWGGGALAWIDRRVLDAWPGGFEEAGGMVSRLSRRIRVGRVQQTALGLVLGVVLLLALVAVLTASPFRVTG